jgi:hypothetical protein
MALPRGYKSISQWFPNEVMSEIIQAAPRLDQVALFRTCKLFHALGVPILYRVVDLNDYTSIEGFCSTVLANPTKFGELVRSLSITTSSDYRSSRMRVLNSN